MMTNKLAALAILFGSGFSTLTFATDLRMEEDANTSSFRLVTDAAVTVDQATDVISFWKEAGPSIWFAKDAAFDRQFREKFLTLHETALRGELQHWEATANGTLALLLLLDQFPRNAFRGTPRAYYGDGLARKIADAAVDKGFDRAVPAELQLFMYLPFGHSEDLADQERSVSLARRLGETDLSHAMGHRDIIKRFNRFPHRNPILGRKMKPEEQKFLDDGGFAG